MSDYQRNAARALLPMVASAFVLAGCATVASPPASALGADAAGHRSIKDELPKAPAAPAPKAAPKPPRAPIARPRPSSCATADSCQALLKSLVSDPRRRWIAERQTPAEYANGTRLFAYRALHKSLTCAELKAALADTGAAAKAFLAPVPGVGAAQAGRVLALNAEVESELGAEFSSRCRS